MRYLKRNKKYNFSLEEFLLMARDGVYNFSSGGETKATTIDKAGSSEKVEKTEVTDSKPVTEEAPKQTVKEHFYQVNKGDTLSGIAKKAGTTVGDIMASNKDLIKDANNIQIGWNLRLPSNSAWVQYAFEKGDTGMGIAKKIGAPWKVIEEANLGTEWNRVPEGHKIWVPNVFMGQDTPVVSKSSIVNTQAASVPPISDSSVDGSSSGNNVASNKSIKIDRHLPESWFFRREDQKYLDPIVDVQNNTPNMLPKNVYSDSYGVFTLKGSPIKYEVKKGDSLEKIAKENNTTVDRLILDNKGINPSKLQIGQKINLQKLNSNVSGFDEFNLDINQPIEWEGFDRVARKGKNEPFYTIGFGHHHKDVKKGQTITEQDAYNYYKKDAEDVFNTIKRWNSNPNLNDYQYQVLFDYGFNAGTGNLKKILVNYINKGQLKEALQHMTPSTQYDINPGLKDRHDWRKSYWGHKSYH